MTIRKLIRLLEKAEKKMGPRAKVTLDWREVHEATEGYDYTHYELNCFDTAMIRWAEDDSFELANGEERMRSVVVLS